MGLNLFKSKPQEVDRGLFVSHPCPVCGKRKLHLVESRMPGLLGAIGFGGGLRIRCAGCSHSVILEAYETDAALALKKHADAFRAGTMTEEQFVERMEKSGLLCLRELAERADKWTCPRCGELVPPTFDVCWKCQATRPGATVVAAAAEGTVSEPVHVDALFGASDVVVHETPAAGAAGTSLPLEGESPGAGRR